ncbi:MAG: PKD domain-containing protein [Bacteroidales bacterium]|jgi:PKD repeat protein
MKSFFLPKFLICLIALNTLTILSYGQIRDAKIHSVNKNSKQTTDVDVDFTADKRSGAPPLQVQFTDQSSGNPVAWLWKFGDGDTSNVQNPVHTYTQEGNYSVRLVVTDSNNNKYSLVKENYIKVGIVLGNCDSLRFPLPEPLTRYILDNNEGYVFGNNKYNDKAIADSFNISNKTGYIVGAIFDFSVATQSAGNNEILKIEVLEANGTNGSPGSLIGFDTISLSRIIRDVNANRLTRVNFKTPIQVSGAFYFGITLPTLRGDSLAFWSTQRNTLPYATAWIKTSNNTWEPASELYGSSGSSFIVSNAIYPKVCFGLSKPIEQANELKVFPNPVTNYIYIDNDKPYKYTITNIQGQKIKQGTCINKIDVTDVNSGFYILYIFSPNVNVFKVIINK